VSESWGSGGGWGNPVVGGVALRIPAIQSPNYNPTAGTGWAIFANGTAVFYGLTITDGTITGPDYTVNSDGAFFYSGTPALGNLLASIASTGGTDAEGNVYQSGVTVYFGTGYLQLHVSSSLGDVPAAEMVTGAGSEDLHAALYTDVSNAGDANEYMTTWLLGAGSTFDGKQAAVALNSAAANGAAEAAGELIYFAPAETIIAYWDDTGIHMESGMTVQADTWHTITMDSGWSTVSLFDAPRYRLLPDGNLQLAGAATLSASRTTAANLNSTHPLVSPHVPLNTHRHRSYDSTATARFAVQIGGASSTTPGVIEGLANSGGAQIIEIDGIIPLN